MAGREFAQWFSSFRENIADYHYYVDFNKVYEHVNAVKIELNILNTLIGSQHIEEDFDVLISRYPQVLRCIPLLLAVREREIHCQDEQGSYAFNFSQIENIMHNFPVYTKYKNFMRETGLFDLLQHHIVRDLVDYVTGIETGLDSNGRKNRSGHLMENLVERFIIEAGFMKNNTYFKEMYIHEIADRWHVDLSTLSHQGKTEKRFDFVVRTSSRVYGIETNFYSSSGSKLNETARSYKTLALEAKSIPNFTFIWITDGKGWTNARHNLEETFDIMDNLYNINDLEHGIMSAVCI